VSKEDKVPDQTLLQPGIAEAIHPEIGNGASWEPNPHAFLLKIPDPSKTLDARLFDGDKDIHPSNDLNEPVGEDLSGWAETHQIAGDNKTSDILPAIENVSLVESSDAGLERNTILLAENEEDKAVTLKKKKKKAKPQDLAELPSSTMSEEEEENAEPKKAPKAGKLVRKAAKSIRKQESEEKLATTPPFALTESTLSPYTQWLKSMRGSDYVHPYDDDFAIAQGEGPAKEGISLTFAELLAAQGYKEQAIEMYMKLMEKYPEKSGFFAAKIEALQ